MRCWHIEWTQTVDGKTRRHTDAYTAETAALALAKWGRMAYCNAKVDAVYDPTAIRAERVDAAPEAARVKTDGDAPEVIAWVGTAGDAEADGFKRLYDIPELGVHFQRVHSPKSVRLTAHVAATPKRGCGEVPRNSGHVYEICIDRADGGAWGAVAMCDGAACFTVASKSRFKTERVALAGLKVWLRRQYKKTIRNRKSADGPDNLHTLPARRQ